jgi:hypothetical protein
MKAYIKCNSTTPCKGSATTKKNQKFNASLKQKAFSWYQIACTTSSSANFEHSLSLFSHQIRRSMIFKHELKMLSSVNLFN